MDINNLTEYEKSVMQNENLTPEWITANLGGVQNLTIDEIVNMLWEEHIQYQQNGGKQ